MRTASREGPQRILEIGIGDLRRSVRMLSLVQRGSPQSPVSYTGIDGFEERLAAAGAALTLRDAYRELRSTGAQVRLVPGDPAGVLPRYANFLGTFDLVVVGVDLRELQASNAWYFVPRLLHAGSQVFVRRQNLQQVDEMRPVTREEVVQLAEQAAPRRRAA